MQADLPLPLFIYGTLRDPALLSASIGRTVEIDELRKARAPGWRTVYFPHEVYPALVRASDDAAPGLLLDNLSQRDFDRLDAYEGEQYRRRPLLTVCESESVSVQAYLPSISIRPDAAPWAFETWAALHRPHVIAKEIEIASRAG